MTARVATRALYVSVVRLLAALVTLVAKAVELLVELTLLGVATVRSRRKRIVVQVPSQNSVSTRARTLLSKTFVDEPAQPASAAERLHGTLVGLGFKAPDVRRFVSSVNTSRLEREPIEVLIKDGLRALGS
jgi:Holliday junction resolvasome RuvABC DNA-binding subunit